MKNFAVKNLIIDSSGINCQLSDNNNFNVRFLTSTMVRVTLTPANGFLEPRTWAIAPINNLKTNIADVPWRGRARESLDGFILPGITSTTSTINTNELCVEIQTNPLRLIFSDCKTNNTVIADRATTAYMANKRNGVIRHYQTRAENERFYGLGDKTGELNLKNRRLRTVSMDSLAYDPQKGDPLYKHWPFVLSRNIYGKWIGIYYDTLASCTFDFGCEHDNYHGFYRYVEIDDGDLDYYLMVGNSPAEVISQFMFLIGGTNLPPKWTLGFAQTAMGLADAPDAQNQLDKFIDKVREHQVPISAFHYGSGYSTIGKKRYVFTWNKNKFPDPKKLNKKFNDNGMRLVANIKPFLLNDHPAYSTINKMYGFINNKDSSEPVIEPLWDGEGAHLDFTNEQTIKWWQDNLQKQILEYGIDIGWNDNNEYCILDETAVSSGFGKQIPIHRSRPLHPLLMTRASFEKQIEFAKNNNINTTPFSVTRAGPPGIQRYAQTWSGDNFTSWQSLKWNIRTGLQMSLSGMFNVGHDVGGFYGEIPNPELFLRWVQACSLNPRMVMNSWKEGGISNVPWMHSEVVNEVIDAIKLRYKLMPYLWELFVRANNYHEPIIRPTFYDFYNDEECFKDCDEFMLGAKLLVAPVVEEGLTTKNIYLPKLESDKNYWRDFYSGEKLIGGKYHIVPAPLNKLPLYVRADNQIPLEQ